MKRTHSISLVILAAVILVGAGCTQSQNVNTQNTNGTQTETISVFTTFYPLQEFVQQVGGEYVTVTNMTPAGVEPHDFEPSPRDIARLSEADLFLVNGAGLDAWADDVADDVRENGVDVIVMDQIVDVRESDPHFWLDPLRAITEVEAIRDALIATDPANGVVYQQNAEDYIATLSILNQDYMIGLEICRQDTAIISHDAFGYLADRYALDMRAIAGISPEQEPSPSALAELTDLARAEEVEYIFFETLVNPSLAETLAAEVGAQTLVLNPIEGFTDEELAAGKNYLTAMRENLHNLQTALECQ